MQLCQSRKRSFCCRISGVSNAVHAINFASGMLIGSLIFLHVLHSAIESHSFWLNEDYVHMCVNTSTSNVIKFKVITLDTEWNLLDKMITSIIRSKCRKLHLIAVLI